MAVQCGYTEEVTMRPASLISALLVCSGTTLSAPALSLPLATTRANSYCELRVGGYAFDQDVGFSAPYEQTVLCNLTIPTGTIDGYASALFGPGIPQVGNLSASAETTTNNGIAEANFGAYLQYFFEIRQFATPPGLPLTRVPIRFGGKGEGLAHRFGYAISRAIGQVHATGDLLAYDDALFKFDIQVVDEIAYDPVDEETLQAGFDSFKRLSLRPSSVYTVTLSTGCATSASPYGQNAAASTLCNAQVGTYVGLDQAAFDDLMGPNSYTLTDYYRIDFSENLPIPEPRVYTLMLAGIGLIGLTRWLKTK